MTRVIVDLERRENPIGGTVRAESEPERRFVGWMGLLAALEAALGTEHQNREDAAPDRVSWPVVAASARPSSGRAAIPSLV